MRIRTRIEVLGLLTGIALCACAAAPVPVAPAVKATSDTCVFFSALYDWQALDDSNLVLWAPGRNDAYHVSLTTPLLGLNFAQTLGYVDGTKDGRLCGTGNDAITLKDAAATQRSTIRSIEHLDAATLAQLEDKYKVQLKRESKRKAPPKTPDRGSAQ